MSEIVTEYDLDEYIEKLRNLSDRGKREVCHFIGLLAYYESEQEKEKE